MTKDEMLERAKAFMVSTYGQPLEMDAAARDRFYERLGVLVSFVSEIAPQDEPTPPHAFETALGEVWKELGQLSPAMVSNDAVNKIVEAAYYAAENALYNAGVLKLVDGRLVVNREGKL